MPFRTVQQISKSQNDTCIVFVNNRKQNVELTHAFRDPQLLINATGFSTKFPRFKIGAGQELEKHVLVIGLKLNRPAISLLTSLNLLLSLLIGILVGLLTRRVDLGVTAASAVAALSCCGMSVFLRLQCRE
jgi:hypothetical protein